MAPVAHTPTYLPDFHPSALLTYLHLCVANLVLHPCFVYFFYPAYLADHHPKGSNLPYEQHYASVPSELFLALMKLGLLVLDSRDHSLRSLILEIHWKPETLSAF